LIASTFLRTCGRSESFQWYAHLILHPHRLEIFENRIIVYGPPSILHEMLNPYFSDHPPLVPLRNAGQAGWKLRQGKKVPDYSFFEPSEIGNSNPKKARQLWPTIIFEVADSQSGKDLRQACMRWITESPKGSLKTVVGIDLSRTTDSSFRKLIISTYRLSWRSKAPPTGWIDTGVQSGRLSLYFHKEESTVCFLFLDVEKCPIQPVLGV